ncbi:MAG: FtsX-like permease family protein [Roseivirga sp.]|nr:FtsX-like permease family protein [Roseivirga sp.]
MGPSKPSKFILRFLKWFCKASYHIDIEGDLLEYYDRNVQRHGKSKADLLLTKEILLLFRPSMMKNISFGSRLIHNSLLNNYFKVSWRNIMQQKLYSFFNVAGLVIGITCFILISIFVSHERSFDGFYENVDNIYHVYEHSPEDLYLGSGYYAVTPAQLAPTLMADYPEVVHATTVGETQALLTYGIEDRWYEKGLLTAPTFFKLFSHPGFVEGNGQTAFQHPRSIILTASLAEKIFPDGDALGKSLIYKDKAHRITGVVNDPPKNSTFQFSFISNLQDDPRYLSEFKKDKWDGSNYYTFFSMHPSADPDLLQQKMSDLIDRYWTKDVPFEFDYLLQPFSDMHLNTAINNDFDLKGNPQQIYLFIIVSLLILILAGINYINLSIARSMIRFKEVGIRKSFGAGRRQLLFQFLLESEILALLAFGISLVITYFLLPSFGTLLNRQLDFNFSNNFNLLLTLIGAVLLLGFLTGIYPALVISSPSTIDIIKGKSHDKIRGKGTQKWLVIFQYAVSIAMVICTLIINQQFRFIGKKELGFEKDQILTLEVLDNKIIKNIDLIKEEWLTNPDVIKVGTSQNLPHDIRSSTLVNDDKNGDPNDDLSISRLRADRDFLEVFGLQLLAGRSLPQTPQKGKKPECLINESAAKALGLSPDEAVGQILTDDSPPRNYRTIIGVVKDFHMNDMHLKISPLLIETRRYFQFISVKAHAQNIPELLEFLDESLKKHSDYPVSFRFMDDRINQLYESEQKKARLFSALSLLTIIIASLGLYGLAALNAHQKVKEIGIRNVLGASISHILVLISGNFIKLIVGGFLIAIPIAWFSMQDWLENYAYRVDIDWVIFLVVGLAALTIALLTVGGQSVKAALANPVDCLRDE